LRILDELGKQIGLLSVSQNSKLKLPNRESEQPLI